MKTNFVAESEVLSDASLVELSVAGDRDAFGQIVARYQSPICALAYSACGNVARSEDLAQETFITAWRRLATLEQPARFKAWLFAIARNLMHNAFRQNSRSPVAGADILEEAASPAPAEEAPDEQAISKEEETILWHVLSGLPEVYREPMVLFYRQNESVQRVAEALEISEEAVRQRLARGRTMLTERVSKVVQSGLRRSAPTAALAATITAGLPLLVASTTAKGAVMGMATTKTATGPATGLLGLLKGVGLFAGLIAIPAAIGGAFGFKLGLDAAGLPQQRESASKFWRVFGAGMAAFLFLPLLLTFCVTPFVSGEARASFLHFLTFWLGLTYPFVLGSLIYWLWRRRHPSQSSGGCVAAGSVDSLSSSGQGSVSAVPRRGLRRAVLWLTLAAAGLLVFCYADMGHNVGRLSPDELRGLINQSAPGELRPCITVSHYRSIWGESAATFREFDVRVRKGGKTSRYVAPVDEATIALLAQKEIACPTYVAGRDFEILGTPGRLLPLLAAFVFAIGGLSLLTRRTASVSGSRIQGA